MPNYIAFIDLMGASSMARNDPDGYLECLEVFKRNILNEKHLLDCDKSHEDKILGEVYFFSDCAYIESTDFVSLAKYLMALRHDLIRQGYFFKGAIGLGELKATGLNMDHEKMFGHYFSKDIVGVYAAHDYLKGIGVNVTHPDKISPKIRKRYLVNSVFLPHTMNTRAEVFCDLKYDPKEITPDVLRNLMSKMFESYAESKRVARYYLSLIISILQSTNFRTKTPPAILNFVDSGQIESLFGDLSGSEYVYYALLNKLYCDGCEEIAWLKSILKKMLSKKRVLKVARAVPACIFSQESKKRFLTEMGMHRIPPPP